VREPSGAFGMRIDSDAPLQIDVKLFQVGTIPEGMVYVPGGDYKLVAWDRPTEETVPLDEFFIDECEVANREFKEFVDAGGYERPEFWKHPFLQHDPNTSEARELTWEEAMCALKEPARGGPASWPNREFPAGKADHPVTNVTWYEAAAYAEFRGKQLPTIFQWEHAARGDARDRRWTVYAASMKPWGYTGLNQNIDDRANVMSTRPSSGTAPVRSFEFGVSPYGCYHMVGNVAEWCLNPRPDGFTTTGGSWRDGPNLFSGVGEYPGFYSAPTLGFRCVRNAPGATGDQGGMPFAKKSDEVPVFEPLDEAAYRLLRSHYEYVRPPAKPLDAKIIEDVETDVWRRIKIRYIGAEGQRTDVPAPERLYALAYLWLPKSARPPYQVLNYKPGGPSYQGLKVPQETEVVCGPFIHAGRAVFVAVIAGMRERDLPLDWVDPEPGTVAYRDMMVYDTVDQRRGLDYLATRDDVDMERIACMGLSMGGYDLITMAVEERFRAVVLLAAGVSSQEGRTIEEANPVNFAPYIRGPKLMIHGRYDEGLPLRTRAEPLYRLLCDPKDLVVLDTGHFPPLDQWVPKVEEFLDRTFGPVSRTDPPPAAHRASAR
jgi:formylglycine-generating enzyme required for sulfatase activity